MALTFDENQTAITETIDGITMPFDYSFKKVNDWVHGVDVHFEEVQCLCLGMANEIDRLKTKLEEQILYTEKLHKALLNISKCPESDLTRYVKSVDDIAVEALCCHVDL